MTELACWHFSYRNTLGDERTETFKFYKKHIRSFLRWHREDAVWIKGGRVGRDAYMIIANEEEIRRNYEKMMTIATQRGFWEIMPFNVYDLLKMVEGRETCGYLHFEQVEIGNPDENWCPDEKYAQVSIHRDCAGDAKPHCCFWNGKNCTSTGAFKRHWSTKLEDTGTMRLTRLDADNWVEDRHRKGDKQKYFVQERHDSPTGETYYRIYRVVSVLA